MTELTHVESLVINEILDDAENLEEIYRSLATQPAPMLRADSRVGTATLPETRAGIALAELADAIRSLVERRLLVVRHDPAEAPVNDLSYVWRCWFEAGTEVRELHSKSNSDYKSR
ncbi:MAG: hypothetical protein B7Z73_07840 [Planctomycetia bacterium 21-64-5]|nr:MAG: hypothetical protein B7Z73_07840 [Planctomycetia bacterium 21-64-5]HQU44190.1 hypothetical protein [Pirellulales bacterium]